MIRVPFRALLMALAAVGCRDATAKVDEESRVIAASWDSAAANSRHPSGGTSPESSAVRLFVDASRSMIGFAGCNAAPTHYNTTLDRLTSDLSILSVVRFGELGRGTGDVFETLPLTRSVHCPAFYNRLQNPDYALYRAAQGDSSGSTYMYVTDGVQSDWVGSNPGPSLGLLKEWVGSGRGLAILAFRSAFSGPVWSEQRQQMLTTATVSNRPFYVFLLAPSDREIDAVLRRLSSATLADAETLRFRADAVRCSARAGEHLSKYSFATSPPWALITHADLQESADILEFDCRIDKQYPLWAVVPRVAARYRQWLESTFKEPKDSPVATSIRGDSIVRTAEGSRVTLRGSLPFDNSARFGLYEFRFDSDPGELRAIVDSLSTDSDAQPDSYSQTYRFSWLIEQLARSHLAGQGWTPFSLTVQYR